MTGAVEQEVHLHRETWLDFEKQPVLAVKTVIDGQRRMDDQERAYYEYGGNARGVMAGRAKHIR
ncbi:hypothetical protein UP06_06445 [Bradyrhizobium sp. LTSP857]|nr:hypothetical protein UP06_06445 [Bradyrhizobium sp. LTSP857]